MNLTAVQVESVAWLGFGAGFFGSFEGLACFDMALLGRDAEPSYGLGPILDYALAGKEEQAERIRGLGMTGAGSLEIPDGGLLVGIRDTARGTATEQVGMSDLVHRFGIPGGGRLLPPVDCHQFVFRDGVSVVVQAAKPELGHGVSIVGQPQQGFDGFRVVAGLERFEGIVERRGMAERTCEQEGYDAGLQKERSW